MYNRFTFSWDIPFKNKSSQYYPGIGQYWIRIWHTAQMLLWQYTNRIQVVFVCSPCDNYPTVDRNLDLQDLEDIPSAVVSPLWSGTWAKIKLILFILIIPTFIIPHSTTYPHYADVNAMVCYDLIWSYRMIMNRIWFGIIGYAIIWFNIIGYDMWD